MGHMPLQSLQESLQSSPELLKDSASSLCPPRHRLCRKLWANPWETDSENRSFESRHCFKMMRWISWKGVPIAHHRSSKRGLKFYICHNFLPREELKNFQEILFLHPIFLPLQKLQLEEYQRVTVCGKHTSTAKIYNQICLSKPFSLSFYVTQ